MTFGGCLLLIRRQTDAEMKQLVAVFAVGAAVAQRVSGQSTGSSACDAAIASFTATYSNCGFEYDSASKQTSVAAWTTEAQAVSCVCAALNANALYACASVAAAQSFIQSTNSLQSSCAALGGSGVLTTGNSNNSNSSNGSSSSGPSMGAIVGGVIGGIVVLGAIGAGVYLYSKKGKDAAPVPLASVPHNNNNNSNGYNSHSTFAEPPLPPAEAKYPQSTLAYNGHPASSPYNEPANIPAHASAYAPTQQYAPTGSYSPPSTSVPSTYAQSSAGEQSNLYQQQSFVAAPMRYNEPEKNSQLFNALSSAASTQQSSTSPYPPQGGVSAKQAEAYKEIAFDTNEAVLWSAGQTAAWLQSLKYPADIVQIFVEGHVDGQFLKVMARNTVHCKEILSNDLGIKDVRIRALLADSICALFEETPAFVYAGGSTQGSVGAMAAPPGYSEF